MAYFFATFAFGAAFVFGFAAAYQTKLAHSHTHTTRTSNRRKTYLFRSDLLLRLLNRTINLLLCLLNNLLSLSSWTLLSRSRLCNASRRNSLSARLRRIGLGRFLRSNGLCDGLDLAWDGDAGLRAGLGAGGGGGGSHFGGFEGKLLERYGFCTIGDCVSEVD